MKRWSIVGLIVAVMLAFVVPAQAASYYWWTQIVDENGLPITSGIKCLLLTAGTDTPSTIYTDATLGTTATNPVTGDGNGLCTFWMSANTAIDLKVFHKRGVVRYVNFDTLTHRVNLNKQVVGKAVAIAFTKQTTEFDTGVTVPKGAIVKRVLINDTTPTSVTATGGTPWIMVGILSTQGAGQSAGHAAGFCGFGKTVVGDRGGAGSITGGGGRALGTAAAGGQGYVAGGSWLGCHAVLKAPVSATAFDQVISTFHSGPLLSRGTTANDVGAAGGHAGTYITFPFIGDGVAKNISYTTSNDSVTGYIWIEYDELGIDPAG